MEKGDYVRIKEGCKYEMLRGCEGQVIIAYLDSALVHVVYRQMRVGWRPVSGWVKEYVINEQLMVLDIDDLELKYRAFDPLQVEWGDLLEGLSKMIENANELPREGGDND